MKLQTNFSNLQACELIYASLLDAYGSKPTYDAAIFLNQTSHENGVRSLIVGLYKLLYASVNVTILFRNVACCDIKLAIANMNMCSVWGEQNFATKQCHYTVKPRFTVPNLLGPSIYQSCIAFLSQKATFI